MSCKLTLISGISLNCPEKFPPKLGEISVCCSGFNKRTPEVRTQTSNGVLRAAQLCHGMGGNTRWQMRMGCMKQIQAAEENKKTKQKKKTDKEGVKVLHTKSQAGRTQKSGPPATRLEGHSLRCTVKLRTACEKTKTGRTEEGEEKRQNTTTRC